MTITHRIVDKKATVTNGGNDVASQLSGMIGQVSALAGGGVGLPALNAMGSQIAALASTITSGPGASNAASIAASGTTMSTAGMGSMAALASSMTTQVNALTSALNPGGLLSQILHYRILDKIKGAITSAFQGQHTTTWDNNGVTHTSSSAVTSTAPQIPHNGTILGSDGFNLTKVMTASNYVTSSDRRLKTNIKDFPPALDRGMAAEVKTFDKHFVATDVVDGKSVQSIHAESRPSFGFIAQDLRKIFPELVDGDEESGFLSVNQDGVGIIALAMLQEFVRETRLEIADLKRRLGEQ